MGTFIVLSLASKSPAPIIIPGKAPMKVERTDAQLAQDQTLNGVSREVGTVPTRLGGEVYDPKVGDQKASSVLVTAERNAQAADAERVLTTATANLEKAESGSKNHLRLGFLIVCLGIAGVFAFKKWADTVLPSAGPTKTKLRW